MNFELPTGQTIDGPFDIFDSIEVSDKCYTPIEWPDVGKSLPERIWKYTGFSDVPQAFLEKDEQIFTNKNKMATERIQQPLEDYRHKGSKISVRLFNVCYFVTAHHMIYRQFWPQQF